MPEAIDHGFSLEFSASGKVARLGITGAGIGSGSWFGFIFGGLLIGGLMSAAGGTTTFGVVFGGMLLVAFAMDANRKRRYEFEITERTIRLPNGKEYAKSDISELVVRNSGGSNIRSASVENRTTVVAGSGITGAAMVGAAVLSNAARNVGASTGQAIADSLNKRGFMVGMRHGRSVIPLAKYLTQDDAISLFNKTNELF